MSRWAALAALFFAAAACAEPDAIVLVAKPELADPNFSGTVVLVTHTPTGDTVGVVLNRPTRLKLSDVAPEFPHAAAYRSRLYAGGPVLKAVIVALFRSPAPPAAPAFPVLDGAYLSMHPDNINSLLERPSASGFRLFAGFAGWAPGQLEAEMDRDSWYVVPVTDDLLFRQETSGMWRELIDRLRSRRAIYFPK
jgi:putative transcriptional regulator